MPDCVNYSNRNEVWLQWSEGSNAYPARDQLTRDPAGRLLRIVTACRSEIQTQPQDAPGPSASPSSPGPGAFFFPMQSTTGIIPQVFADGERFLMTESAYRTAFEGAARIFAQNFAALLSIVQPVEDRPFPRGIWQHFPNRRKWYRTTEEFYVLQGDPEGVIAAIRATDAGPDQVIDVIGPDPAQDDPVYQAAGYQCDDTEILMDRSVTVDDLALGEDPRIVTTLTDEQVARLAHLWNWGRTANDYQPIVPAHNTAPGLVQAYIELDGQPAAYGRAMMVGADALLTDVNAFPGFRRRGLGRAIMHSLHAGLARGGATRVVLTATEMGLPLYEQFGYRTLAQDWIYVSQERRSEN